MSRSLDSMIGRAAHIAFIDNSALIKLSLYSFDELFDWFTFLFLNHNTSKQKMRKAKNPKK